MPLTPYPSSFFKTFHNPAIHILFRLKFASDSFAPNEEISNRESQQSWKQIRGSKPLPFRLTPFSIHRHGHLRTHSA
ncbi:expressed protein [Cryptococcus deneoformans JEC21]|uniref:Expressed protein n=1 Tax=Cryptococcus deneoformans (strain JEC21 / ATCC MYA-565) TaxID=214684 RepID=Q5KLW3_CRYD1|nr:expressed protein [Cryptococcus neoformans var. neoformans JEC21]AAW41906.2 expressed protein [Cryptococcus neoformans var. neoformans JEC21]